MIHDIEDIYAKLPRLRGPVSYYISYSECRQARFYTLVKASVSPSQ